MNLNLGNDICHVVRIRSILESDRAARFVQKILNTTERDHPKIRRLSHRPDPLHTTGQNPSSVMKSEPHGGQGVSSGNPGLGACELQTAATFLAGRYGSLSQAP